MSRGRKRKWKGGVELMEGGAHFGELDAKPPASRFTVCLVLFGTPESTGKQFGVLKMCCQLPFSCRGIIVMLSPIFGVSDAGLS